MTTYIDRLKALGACSDAIDWCRANHPTDLRAAWEDCPDSRWMIWLIVRLDRRRGVGVTVEVVRATCAHLASNDVTVDVLNQLAAWAAGDDTVDMQAVRDRAWEIKYADAYAAASAYAAAAADAADAASAVADAASASAAADAASAVADAASASAAAYTASADADAAADWSAMQAMMIRDLVDADEVMRMLADKRGGG